jgi:hypothetical protein
MDLRCAFGCKEIHRKRASTRRSVEYYRDSDGKKRRRIQNGNRTEQARAARAPEPEKRNDHSPAGDDQAVNSPANLGSWRPPLVEHVRMVSSLIEGRRVSVEEILAMLAKVLRQHSIGRRRKIDHVIDWLHKNPP